MAKVIIFTRPVVGGIAVVYPLGQQEGESEQDWLARVAAKSVPEGVSWRAVELAELPSDHTLSHAWIDNGTTVALDPALLAENTASALLSLQDAAVLLATDPAAIMKAIRGLMLVMMDEINILRTRDRDRSADVAGAATLAALKTAWSARSSLTNRTAAQIKPALAARIRTPDAE